MTDPVLTVTTTTPETLPTHQVVFVAPPPPKPDDVEAARLRMLAKVDGDVVKLSSRLTRMNMEVNGTNKLLQTQIETISKERDDLKTKLTSASVPADKIVISKTDAELLAAYQAIGQPEQIVAERKKLVELDTQLKTVARDKELSEVARVAGYVPEVFVDLVTDGMSFEPTKTRVGIKDVDSFKVLDTDPKTGKERVRHLVDLEAAEWKHYVPALRAVALTVPLGNSGLPRGDAPYRRADEFRGNPRKDDKPTDVDKANYREAHLAGVNMI